MPLLSPIFRRRPAGAARPLAAALLLCMAAGSAAHGTTQRSGPRPLDPAPDVADLSEVSEASAFRFDVDASAQLQALWQASTSVKQELVACIGGSRSGGVWRIDRVEPVAAAADSVGVSANVSIERCGPPRWLGTVHTHIALRPDGQPYATLSGADRGVMSLWWRRWRTQGVFCVLYTAHDAHCEADGQLMAGPATHATY
jgi:hypothetical protein